MISSLLSRMGRRGKRASYTDPEAASPAKRPAFNDGQTSQYFTKTVPAEGASGDQDTSPKTGTSLGEGVDTGETDVTKSQCVRVRLDADFFDQPCEDLARSLLGQTLVRVLENGQRLAGTIVETESYLGGEDKASHSYNGKQTERNAAMFMAPGTAYVYHIYGMYTCMNISSRGEGAAVLLRGLAATEGPDTMRKARGAKRSDAGKKLKDHELCNGPSKLTQALQIDKAGINKQDLSTSPHIWVEQAQQVPPDQVVACPRIGINYAEEWTDAALRFYIKGTKAVSVRNKGAEAATSST